MNIKKRTIMILSIITLIVIIVLKYTIQDLPQWVFYVLICIFLVLIILYPKPQKKDLEKEAEEEENRKKELIAILETKADSYPTASVMYGILTKQILEIQALVEKKNLEIEFDLNIKDEFYEVVISSKYKQKNMYYLSLSFEQDEEELLLNSDEEIKTDYMKESEIIELIIDDINKFQ